MVQTLDRPAHSMSEHMKNKDNPSLPLSDIQVHELLTAARKLLGNDAAETVRGDTALNAARQVLSGLGLALLLAGEQESDRLVGVKDQDET